MIEVKNLIKKYDERVAVNDLSFTLTPGKIYGFLGPNGAGKSTTMNIMTGYIGATSGSVIINGFDILEQPEEAKSCIGYLPEIPPLYLDMTVTEYLKFVGRLKKISRECIVEEIEKVKKLTKIKEVEGRLIKNLSKGYRQRVGLAYAILGFPEIIILDEPTVGLDPKQIIEIRDLIKTLSEKHTVILSSHILTEISEICDYILIISKGKLVKFDTIENIYKLTKKTDTIELKIKGTEEEVKKVLSNIPEISIIKSEINNFLLELSIEYNGKDETIQEISYELALNRIPIMELKKQSSSLEDLFLELTSDQELLESEVDSNINSSDCKEGI